MRHILRVVSLAVRPAAVPEAQHGAEIIYFELAGCGEVQQSEGDREVIQTANVIDRNVTPALLSGIDHQPIICV